MDIKEIKKCKTELEICIKNLITDFTEKTDLSISDIRMDKITINTNVGDCEEILLKVGIVLEI